MYAAGSSAMYSKWCCNPVVSLPLFVSLFHFWLLPLRLLSLQRAVAMSSYCNEAAWSSSSSSSKHQECQGTAAAALAVLALLQPGVTDAVGSEK
jgi:hypothetical protein